jgi:hypothetical protein
VGPGRLWQTARNRSSSSSPPVLRGPAGLLSPIAGANVAGMACAALGALALVGCGSSSSKPEPGESAFVASANAACQAATTAAQAIKKPNGRGSVSLYYAHLDPIAHDLLQKLTALTPPPAKQAEYAKLLDLWRKEIVLASARAKAAKAGDERQSAILDEEGHSVDTQFDSTANALGLTECSRNL